jgi:hypothetical protein
MLFILEPSATSPGRADLKIILVLFAVLSIIYVIGSALSWNGALNQAIQLIEKLGGESGLDSRLAACTPEEFIALHCAMKEAGYQVAETQDEYRNPATLSEAKQRYSLQRLREELA